MHTSCKPGLPHKLHAAASQPCLLLLRHKVRAEEGEQPRHLLSFRQDLDVAQHLLPLLLRSGGTQQASTHAAAGQACAFVPLLHAPRVCGRRHAGMLVRAQPRCSAEARTLLAALTRLTATKRRADLW